MPRAPRKPRLPVGENDLFRLLRYSHIFASAVQQVLEIELLRKATSLPLTVSQFHVLKLMTLNGRHQVGEIADFLGATPRDCLRRVPPRLRLLCPPILRKRVEFSKRKADPQGAQFGAEVGGRAFEP